MSNKPWSAPDILDDHSQRIDRMERFLSGTVARQAAKASSGILPPGTTIDGTPLSGDISEPLNLLITTGALYDKVYADLHWDPPVTGHAAGYEIIVTKDADPGPGFIDDYWRTFTSQANSFRISDLVPGETYHVRVYAFSVMGIRSDPSADGPASYFVAAADATIPATTTGFQMYSGLRTIICTWNENTEHDVARGAGQYEVQVDTVADFSSSVSFWTTGLILSVPSTVAGTTYYGRVRAIDTSGNEGPWSTTDNVVSGQAGTIEIGDGVIVSDHIVTAGLDAGVIKFGQMTGDRIQANTLDADKIKTSQLTAADITLAGGSLRAGNPPLDGVLFNEHGVRAYKSSAITFSIDEFGDAVFNDVSVTGTFQTAISGPRVRIQKTGGISYVELFSGVAGESSPAKMYADLGSLPGYGQLVIAAPQLAFSTRRPFMAMYSTNGFTIGQQEILLAGDKIVFQGLDFPAPAHIGVLNSFGANGYMLTVGAVEIVDYNNSLTQYSNPAPFRVGRLSDSYNIAIGGADLQATANSGNEALLQLNRYSPSPSSGVTMGNHAYAGRWSNGFDLTAQFCHKNFAGSPYYYGMRQTDSGALAFGGSSYAFYNLLSSAASGSFVAITGLGVLYQYTSSRKNKDNILPLAEEVTLPSPAILHDLQVKSYTAKEEDTGQRYYGLIAEEVAELAPALGVYDENGDPKNVSWSQIWPLMIAEIQRLHREVEVLKSER